MSVYIVGGGTLSRFVIDILESMKIGVGGVYDDKYPGEKKVLGYAVLGKIEDVPLDHKELVVAIGEPEERKRLMEMFKASGHSFPLILHKTSFISRHAKIEEGAIIGPACNILAESKIGKGVCLLANVNINQNTRVGDYSLLGAGVNVGNNAVLHEGCHVGMSCVIPPDGIVNAWEYIKERKNDGNEN